MVELQALSAEHFKGDSRIEVQSTMTARSMVETQHPCLRYGACDYTGRWMKWRRAFRARVLSGRVMLPVALGDGPILAGCSPGGEGPDDQTLIVAAVDDGDLKRLRELNEVFLEDRLGASIQWVVQVESEFRETVSTDVGTEAGGSTS